MMIQGPSITRESKQAGCKVVGKDLDIGASGHAGKTEQRHLSHGLHLLHPVFQNRVLIVGESYKHTIRQNTGCIV